MPSLTRAFVKAALCWLIVAFILLALVAAAPMSPSLGRFGVLGPAAIHGLVAGFTLQLIFGIALWMFPRPRETEAPWKAGLGWFVFVALNAGLLLRLVTEPLVAFAGGPWWGRTLALSAIAQFLAGLGFVMLAWPRVRGR